MIYIFRADDPCSDRGRAEVVIHADSSDEARRILHRHCDSKGRGHNLVFIQSQRACEIGVIFSNLEVSG